MSDDKMFMYNILRDFMFFREKKRTCCPYMKQREREKREIIAVMINNKRMI